MRPLSTAIFVIGLIGFAATSNAQQHGAHIAYPLDGQTYVVTSDNPILPLSFSVTCKDLEDRKVAWSYGMRSQEDLGYAIFGGTTSMQFLQKFSKGKWVFVVESECGSEKVAFEVKER